MSDETYPKVLIVSHNALSTVNNNGKTLNTLFYGWPCERIAQIYFYPEIPVTENCETFYRITDTDLIKSMLLRTGHCGGPISRNSQHEDTHYSSVARQFYKSIARYKNDFFIVARDAVWKCGKWDTPAFRAWLKAFGPDAIFFVGSESQFSYDLVFWICQFLNVPLFTYFTDDYISSKFDLNPFFWTKLIGIRRRFRKAINLSRQSFVIGEEMAEEYAAKFGGNFQILTNTIEHHPLPVVEKSDTDLIKLVYVGNLGLERWQTLSHIGRCLAQLDALGLNGELLIYAHAAPQGRILDSLTLPPFMRFCGSLDTEGVNQVLTEADIVVHVESFSRKTRYITRLSVSAKIPEYLAYGKCILAYGPADIASIRYLKKYDAAVVSTCREELYNNLKTLLSCNDVRSAYRVNASNLAITKHARVDMKKMLNERLIP